MGALLQPALDWVGSDAGTRLGVDGSAAQGRAVVKTLPDGLRNEGVALLA